MTTNESEIAIIGAGPYGLSIAAWLRAQKIDYRIFGNPMNTWRNQMPKGMCLKSEGFASTLYDPDSAFTLERFCWQSAIPYADTGLPVKLDTFISYGMEFQRRMVPNLEDSTVVKLERSPAGYRLQLDNGEIAFAKKVVIAAGISHFQYLPPVLSGLPEEFVTHSSSHPDLSEYAGRDVTVIGAGASAMDVAAILHGAGANVRVVARKPIVRFHNPPKPLPRPFLERVRAPMTGLGPGWRSLFCVKGPLLFHRMPEAFRLEVVKRHLGPAPAWFVKEVVVGNVEMNLGCAITDLAVKRDKVHLQVSDANGQSRSIVTDHVIAGTGYRVDLKRLAFLSPALQSELRTAGDAPVLATSFESSVPGLYFVGAAAAPSFGPLLRFAYGAGFTARHLSRHLAKSAGRRLAPQTQPAGEPLMEQKNTQTKERQRNVASVRG